jgi:hypothetical protein
MPTPNKKVSKPVVKKSSAKPAAKSVAVRSAAKPAAKPAVKSASKDKYNPNAAIWGCYGCGHSNAPESKECWDCETSHPGQMRWLDPSTGETASAKQITAAPKSLKDRVSAAYKGQ